MGRYDPMYADEQRDAIIRAVLEDGLSAREAVEKAGRGDLDMPAFQMPVSTAQSIVTQSKRRRLVDGWNERIENGTERLVALAESELAEAERRKEKSEPDHGATKRAADNLLKAQRLVKEMEIAAEKTPQNQTREPADSATGPSEFALRLQADLEAEATRAAQQPEQAAQKPAESPLTERQIQEGRARARKLGLEEYLPEAYRRETDQPYGRESNTR